MTAASSTRLVSPCEIQDADAEYIQAPLLLPLFSFLPSPSTFLGRIASILLYSGLDLASADCLFRIASSGAAAISSSYISPRASRTWNPASIAAVYLFNPFTLLACLGRPTSSFTAFFTLLSIKHACQAEATTSAFALAIATYLGLHPALLLPPIGLLCYDQLCKRQIRSGIKDQGSTSNGPHAATSKVVVDQRSLPSAIPFGLILSSAFAVALAFLLGLSRLLLPSWQFVPVVYMTPLTLPDLTPNPGLWWYFFIEMFDAFREFFLGVFWLHMLSYSVPLSIRLRKQPLAAVVLMMGILATFQPYANIGDVGAWLSSLCLLGHIFECKTETHSTTCDPTDGRQCAPRTATLSRRSQPCSMLPCLDQLSTTYGYMLDRETQTSSTPSLLFGAWRC